MNKKINKEAKRQGKDRKQSEKIVLIKKKEKVIILCETGGFYAVRGIF